MAAQNWYHDPANTTGYASDNNSGSNYTAPITGTHGVTNGTTTFVDATANAFTLGMVGQYINILTKAQYKVLGFTSASTITLSGSPTSASGLTWNLGGPKVSLNQFNAANGMASGDNINLAKSPDTVRVQDTAGNNLNGTFTNQSNSIPITATSGSVTLDIDQATSGWTAATNVTASTSGTRKLGATAVSLTTNASFTGAALVGFKATGTLDLSPYTKFCFWIQAAANAGVLTVTLCSDTAGVTAVHTATLPALSGNGWYCFTFDNHGALSSSIKSVAVRTTATYASKTILINNIFATNRLTLTSCITKDSSVTSITDGMYPIQSITNSAGTSTVKTDEGANFLLGSSGIPRGYSGATATVAVYVRESSLISTAQTTAFTPAAANPIIYSGGWNFSTGSQDGFSLIGPGDINITPFSIGASWNLSSFGTVRGATGIQTTNATANITGTVCAIGANSWGVDASVQSQSLMTTGSLFCIANFGGGLSEVGGYAGLVNSGTLTCLSNASNGYSLAAASGLVWTGSIVCNNNSASGILNTPSASFGGNNSFPSSVTCKDNGSNGIQSVGSLFIGQLTTSGNTIAVRVQGGGQILIGNFIPSEATVVFLNHDFCGSYVQCTMYNSTPGDYRQWSEYGNVLTSSGTVHGTAPLSINLQPNANANATTPLTYDLQLIAIDNTSTTLAGFSQHDNAAVVCGLIWPGGYVPGVSSDVVSADSGGTGAWTAVSVTATATNNYGGFRPRLYSHAAGGTGHNSYFSIN